MSECPQPSPIAVIVLKSFFDGVPNDLLESVDVVLEFAREEFADFLVEAIDVGDQGQQAEEKREDEANTDHYLVLVFGSLLGRRTGAASGAVAGSIVATGRDFISTVVSASGCWEGVG